MIKRNVYLIFVILNVTNLGYSQDTWLKSVLVGSSTKRISISMRKDIFSFVIFSTFVTILESSWLPLRNPIIHGSIINILFWL